MTHRLHAAAAAALAAPLAALAETTGAPPAPISAGSALQVVLALAVVLAAIAAAAWLVRRVSVRPGIAGDALRMVGGIAVGQRERVVVIDVDGTWLILGVAPGRVNALHSMPRPPRAAHADANPSTPPAFAAWLKQTLARRQNG